MADDLLKLSRDELETRATAEGIQDPARFSTKAELVDAITTGDAATAPVTPEPDSVPDGDREDILAEFHATGLVREGFVVNYAWPDVVRKVT